MKKHLQFNDITALSLGWRAARRKAEKERRAEREKEQSSSSLLCIFIKENMTSLPLVLSFFSRPFGCFVSLIYIFFPFLSPHPFSSVLAHPFLVLPPTHFPVLSIVSPYSSIWAIQFCRMRSCLSTMYLFSALCCPGYSSQSTGLSEGLECFISKRYKSALLPAVLAPSSPGTCHFTPHPTPRHHSTLMSNH